MGAVAVESWRGSNEVSLSRDLALERTVIIAVEISHANKSKSTTVSMWEYTFVSTSSVHIRRMEKLTITIEYEAWWMCCPSS